VKIASVMAAAVLGAWTAGCDSTRDLAGLGYAPLNGPPCAVRVDVRDAVTGAPAAFGARGEVRWSQWSVDMEIADQWPPVEPQAASVLVAWNDSNDKWGPFFVVVWKPGYRAWRANGVSCPGEILTAQLQPETASRAEPRSSRWGSVSP